MAQNLGVDVRDRRRRAGAGTGPTTGTPDAAAATDMARELIHPGDCILVKGSRAAGLEVVAEALARGAALVVRVLVAGILALLISIVIGPRFIRFLREREYGQQIREEGPSHHIAKQGTPTMGGVLIVVAMAIPFLALGHYTTNCAARLPRHARLRRDRLRRRLHQADAQALARPAAAAGSSLLLAPITAGVGYVMHRRRLRDECLHPRDQRQAAALAGPGTCSSSSSSPAPPTA